MISRRDWWVGIGLVVAALLVHAAVPRYEWRGGEPPRVRVDRWTGQAEIGRYYQGRWISPALEQAWREYNERTIRVPLSELRDAPKAP